MQPTSSTYRTLFAMPNHYKEWRVSINGVVYGQDVIVKSIDDSDCEPVISRPTFLDTPTVGNCYAAQFTCVLLLASSQIPRMATVIPSYRLRAGNQASEWITEGTFYLDIRAFDKESNTVSLTCYDDMLKTDGPEGKTYAELTEFDEWPQPMEDVVDEICDLIGISLDARTTILSGNGYMVGYPNDYTMREILGFIAAVHGGNFVISPQRALRLIRLTGSSDSVSSLGEADLTLSEAFSAWSQVVVYYADEDAYEAGTDTGRLLEAEDPWAEQSTANGLLSIVNGVSYQPFSVSVAILDPALEIGDTLTLSVGASTTISVHIWSIEIDCDSTSVVSVSAPGESAVDHEYPYVSYSARQMRRMVKLGQPYYGVTISKKSGIEIKRSDGLSEALFNSDVFAMRALIDGVMKDRIYFDPVKGDYVFDGALGADAVFTDSLYAEQGDIAELTVDRLSTSRRVRLYNLQNTGDDNFLEIQDNYLRLITGTVNYDPNDPTTPLTEQATNRYGQGLYWSEIPYSINAQGYPLDEDGNQIYATTDVPTPGEGETIDQYKVMVYQYTELVKSELAFFNESGTYVPMLIMGAGDNNGRTKGILHKAADGFDITFEDTAGESLGLKMNSAGYMDLYGLRKPTELDFSGWDYGYFSEELDGQLSGSWIVDFDGSGRPIKFTDGDGHETAVVW